MANTTTDNSALSVNQNETYGVIGITYRPSQADIGQWTAFTAGIETSPTSAYDLQVQ